MNQQQNQVCQNCLKSFPESKIATHFGYCRRNIKKCDKCHQMYDINFLQEHQQEFHKLSKCNYCKKDFQQSQIKHHESNCDNKTKFCQYCDLDVPIKQYFGHVKECQARTKPCQKCKKPVSNKQYLGHLVSCPGYIEQSTNSFSSSNQYSNYSEYIQNQQKKKVQDSIKHNVGSKQQNSYKYQEQNKYEKKSEKINPTYAHIAYKERKPEIPAYDNNSNSFGVKKYEQKNYIQTKQEIKNPPKQQKNITKESKGAVRDIKDTKNNIGNEIPSKKNKFDSYGSSNNPIGIENKPKYSLRAHNINVNHPQIRKIEQKKQKIISPTYQNNKERQPNTRQLQQNNKYKNVGMKKNAKIQNQKEFNRKQEKANFSQKYQEGIKKNTPINIQNNFYPEENFSQEYYSPQHFNQYQVPNNNYKFEDEDPELQKAIMMSMGGNSVKAENKIPNKGAKKVTKMDQVKPQQIDMMNQSFYQKQKAIYEQIKGKKRR